MMSYDCGFSTETMILYKQIPVRCKRGDCKTCYVVMNGKKVKACWTNLPKGKCDIQTLK